MKYLIAIILFSFLIGCNSDDTIVLHNKYKLTIEREDKTSMEFDSVSQSIGWGMGKTRWTGPSITTGNYIYFYNEERTQTNIPLKTGDIVTITVIGLEE